MNAVTRYVCPCGLKTCRGGTAKSCAKRCRKIAALKLPTLERCNEVEHQVRKVQRALEHHKSVARLLDVDLTQRYILVQELGLKLASLIGPKETEAFIRSAVPSPFVRTLGPLAPIFQAMHANELAGQAAAARALELPLPDGFNPRLRGGGQ